MDLRAEEHGALNRLARYGAMPVGQGPDCIPISTAIRFGLAGMATISDGDGQQVHITRQGRAFNHRTVR